MDTSEGKSGWNLREAALLLVVVALIVVVAWPNFIGNGHRQPQYVCINNLRAIDNAATEFALEHHLTNGDRINFPNDLTPYIKLSRAGKITACPAGGVYRLDKVGDRPTCSIGTNVIPAHILP